MKITCAALLTFLCFHCFSQETDGKYFHFSGDQKALSAYEKVNGLNDTLARIFVKGKVGLIHRNGTLILEPNYTAVDLEPLGIRFYDGALQGFIPKETGQPIPAIYKEIIRVYACFEARTENETMDLYFGSELIASDLDQGLQESDVLYKTGLIIIRKEEKTGMINEKGEIIVPIDYSVIERIPSFLYESKDQVLLDFILVLDKSDYFYSPEAEGYYRLGEPVLYIAKADGTPIADTVFSEVSAVNPETNTISLKYHQKMAELTKQFEIAYSPYESVTEFLEWKFYSTGKQQIIFNRFDQPIDSFTEIMIPNKLSWTINENDGEATSYSEILFEDFVYVVNRIDEKDRMAIYDLKNQKVVSNWEKNITFESKGTSISGTTVWGFKDETGRLAYSVSTAKKSSAYDYQEMVPVSDRFYALKKWEAPFYTLYELVGDSVLVERMEIEKPFGSLNYAGRNTRSVREFDPELKNGFTDQYGNYFAYSSDSLSGIPPFRTPFTMFKNTNGKFGFISWNGKVVDLNADTLFQSDKSSTLIAYRCGELWGAAEIAWGSNFKPGRSSWENFYLIEDVALIYHLSSDEKYYVDSKGNTFYSASSERDVVKKGKLKGSYVWSDFDDEQKVGIPFVYKELLSTWNQKDYLAQSITKKWGIISAVNDTIFSFKYDRLSFDEGKFDGMHEVFPYTDYDEICYTTIGKFHGILSLNLRKEIPAVYEEVTYVADAGFIVKQNGKFGVYDCWLNERIKPVFDEVFIAASIEGVYVLRARKANKWYNIEFYEGKIPTQTELLQMPAFDLVFNETGFIKKEQGYDEYNLLTGKLQNKGVNVAESLDTTFFRFKDGRIYLVDFHGKQLYPEGFTNLVDDGARVVGVLNGVVYAYSVTKKDKVPLKY